MGVDGTPFWLFGCAYGLFLSPVIVLLAIHFMRHQKIEILPWSVSQDSALTSVGLLALWMFLLGGVLRAVLWCLGWKIGPKRMGQHNDDFVRMGYLHVSLVFLGRVHGRLIMDSGMTPGLSYLLLIAFYAAFFSLLFEMVRHIDVRLSLDLGRNPGGLAIVLVGALVLCGVILAHVQMAFDQGLLRVDSFGAHVARCGAADANLHDCFLERSTGRLANAARSPLVLGLPCSTHGNL